MKIKCLPEDFRVEETTALQPAHGPTALYQLRKESLGTLEAIRAIAERWKIPESQFSFGGLKDRHASTSQWISIDNGPRRNLSQSHLSLEYAGQIDRPFCSDDIRSNRFHLVIRDLSESDARQLVENLAGAEREGVPNYFDRQRFGSRGRSGEFTACPWCQGDFERALWLALAEPNRHDRPGQRIDKQSLRHHWGDWGLCHELIHDPPVRRILEFLVHNPRDFRRAFAMIDVRIRRLYLAAFQSWVWNELLASCLKDACDPAALMTIDVEGQLLPFLLPQQAHTIAAAARPGALPLPSARLHLSEHDPLLAPLQSILQPYKLSLREMRVKYPRDSFFSKGDRAAFFHPADCSEQSDEDELHASRRKLTLNFDLPPGAYATMLLKALTVWCDESLADNEDATQ